MRVLYIEDGSTRSAPITRYFQGRGGDFELEVAAGATEAIARIEEHLYDPYDMALADRSVPDHECAELIRYVRERRLNLSVIVCSYLTEWVRILMSNGGFAAGPDTIAYSSIDPRGGSAKGGLSQGISMANWTPEREPLLEAIIESLPARLVVLDRDGVISYENKASTPVHVSSQPHPAWTPVGVNYLEACTKAADDGDQFAIRAMECVRSVLAGEVPRAGLEYACDDSADSPWFLMQVDHMPPGHGGVVISHNDITSLKQAEASLRSAVSELEKLRNQLQQENLYLQQEMKLEHYSGDIIGDSDALRSILRKVEQVAPTDSTVLVLGETGTGKELIARAIHGASLRRNHPLVRVNCAALPPSLIESELFGHERGAFTGAQSRKIGRFELADSGTIMLDEIGELAPELQVKLLRVLQEGEFERLGSTTTIRVNVRVIAVTNRDLKQDVQEGRFRADLWYRLNVFPLTVPPLRDRRQDLRVLVKHFVSKFSKKVGKRFTAISPSAIKALEEYCWPGNIRELASVIERAVIVSPGPMVSLADNLSGGSESTSMTGDARTLEEIERQTILNRLEETGWKIEGKAGAAESLGLNPSTLRSRMIKFGIRAPQKQHASSRL